MRRLVAVLYYIIFTSIIIACNDEKTQFELLSSDYTGVKFANTIIENDSVNILDYEYVYNGGGVAIGDINNDGLEDIFLSGNQVSSKLYLNQGDFKFRDITQEAGIIDEGWVSGVSFADVNNDNLLDLYVCYTGSNSPSLRQNKLYINKGNLRFENQANKWGVDLSDWTTHAAFFDLNNDGLLDMYALNHANSFNNDNVMKELKANGEGESNDRLFLNTGDRFIEITEKANIKLEGYGLGVAIHDFNGDNLSDIYVSNDYYFDDLLYINNGDSSFTESSRKYFKHLSNFAMGNDVSDFNNDGLDDLFVLDMLPPDNYRRKKLVGPIGLDLFNATINLGYQPQYMRNTLQMNNGEGYYSEIGQLAGVHSTDWSWSGLFADFDNDGMKDLYITNGFKRDMTDRDFILYKAIQERKYGESSKANILKYLHEMEGAKMSNFLYRNNGQLEFKNVNDDWGVNIPSLSNGAAYADLNNDGYLDLIVNNIDDEAFIFKNRGKELNPNNYLKVKLTGHEANLVGATAYVYYAGGTQKLNYYKQRGFQSSVTSILHFGLGEINEVDSVLVLWKDGNSSIKRNVESNQQIEFLFEKRSDINIKVKHDQTDEIFFKDSLLNVSYVSDEYPLPDFKREPLLPHRYSRMGPGIGVSDINKDGLEDFYIAGTSGSLGRLFIAQKNNGYEVQYVDTSASYAEEMHPLFFDANGDGFDDLYISVGGNDVPKPSQYYYDRFYLNDGDGQFILRNDLIPRYPISSSKVVAGDIDNDGDLDLVIAGRVFPGKFPLPTNSYIYRNDKGKFIDVTSTYLPQLEQYGMVSDLLLSDYDSDGLLDLIIVGEWTDIGFFKNKGEVFEKEVFDDIKNLYGWWNSILANDFDNDGDIDYIIGNLGNNNPYNVSETTPLRVYAKDFDNNSKLDPIITYYNGGVEHTMASRDMLIDQMSFIRPRFPRYEKFANSSFKEILSDEERKGAYQLKVTEFKTVYLENNENGFKMKELPQEVQMAPVFGMVAVDVNKDGYDDVVGVGNSFSTEVFTGAYDAHNGFVLINNEGKNFEFVRSSKSGFYVQGDGKALVKLISDNKLTLLASQNSDSLKHYSMTIDSAVYISDHAGRAFIQFENGKTKTVENYHGSSYLSSSSNKIIINNRVEKIMVGKDRRVVYEK